MKTSDAFGVKARTRANILCFDKVVLWGAGSALGDCADAIGKDNIAAVFDSNEKLWGQTRKGFHILPPSELNRETVFSGENTGTIDPDFRGGQANEIEVDTLDNMAGHLDRVDYIKFDIEGFEMPALRGARALIAGRSPYMLVSAYHKVTDMWEIPLYVLGICPRYKCYLAHQPNVPYEPEYNFLKETII